MKIAVLYLDQACQCKQVVEADEGSTIGMVLLKHGIVVRPKGAVGVFGELKALDYRLSLGERIEIYAPLMEDPKHKRLVKLKEKIWKGSKAGRSNAPT